MKYTSIILFFFIIFSSCSSEIDKTEENNENHEQVITKITTNFSSEAFDDSLKLNLLNEINICFDTNAVDLKKQKLSLCSPENFAFYRYSNKISLENGFLLQVKAGVNDFNMRRLLFFIRENGRLVTMNNIIGYLVEKRSTDTGFDDLVVSLTDNLEGSYERYDILLKYKEGKYVFVEVLGDLHGEITDKKMKAEAKEFIEERIRINNLMF